MSTNVTNPKGKKSPKTRQKYILYWSGCEELHSVCVLLGLWFFVRFDSKEPGIQVDSVPVILIQNAASNCTTPLATERSNISRQLNSNRTSSITEASMSQNYNSQHIEEESISESSQIDSARSYPNELKQKLDEEDSALLNSVNEHNLNQGPPSFTLGN